jgi:hypothetical protein
VKFCKLRYRTLQHHLFEAQLATSNLDIVPIDGPRMEIEEKLPIPDDVGYSMDYSFQSFPFPIPSSPNSITRNSSAPQSQSATVESVETSNEKISPIHLLNQSSSPMIDSSIPSANSNDCAVVTSVPTQKTPKTPTKKKKPTSAPSTPSSAPSSSNANRRVYFPKSSTIELKRWLDEHHEDPYPDAKQKRDMALATGLTYDQVQHWFINARMRIWRPMLRKQKEAAERQLFHSQVEKIAYSRGSIAPSLPSSSCSKTLGVSPTIPQNFPTSDAGLTPQQWHKKIREEHLKLENDNSMGTSKKLKSSIKTPTHGARGRPKTPRKMRQ